MAKQSLLQRGFKSKAEKIALEYREKLNLLPHDSLCGFELAKHLKIPVYTPEKIFPKDTNLDDLIGTPGKDKGWSALTMKTETDSTIIIHNPLHLPSRQQSDLMHELAHIICEHGQHKLKDEVNLPFFMRKFDPQQEEEANCLGASLQITREGLIWAFKERMNKEQIAEHFNASLQMVTLRINMTGVERQLRYLRG